MTPSTFETFATVILSLAFGLAFGLTLDAGVGTWGWAPSLLGAAANGAAAVLAIATPLALVSVALD